MLSFPTKTERIRRDSPGQSANMGVLQWIGGGGLQTLNYIDTLCVSATCHQLGSGQQESDCEDGQISSHIGVGAGGDGAFQS